MFLEPEVWNYSSLYAGRHGKRLREIFKVFVYLYEDSVLR